MTEQPETPSKGDYPIGGGADGGAHQKNLHPTREPVSRLGMAAIVGFFVILGHATSIDTGLFLDDHAHYEHLHKLDWSFKSAVESSRLGIVGDVIDLWGRKEAGLRFFRPLAFWIMKIEYTIGHWHPAVMHIFSIGWHFACSMLVGVLAMRCFGRRLWATVAASLMALHPAQVAAVHWVACQTELMATFFLLVGILAYSRHAGWGMVPAKGSGRSGLMARPWFLIHRRELNLVCHDSSSASCFHTVTFAGIVAVLCYAIALGCRENAVLFPAVCWLGDRLCGNPRRRRIRWEHIAMALVLITYLVIRYVMLGGFPMPAKPYVVPVSDPGFAQHVIQKVVCYTLGLFAYVPMVPIGGRAYLADRPMAFYGGFAVSIAILTAIWAAYRFRRTLLWPLVWIACLIAPVIPVFASAHHLYLPGVGMALLLGAGLAALGGLTRQSGKPTPRVQTLICTLVILVHVLGLGTLTWGIGFAYKRGTLPEDILVKDVIQRGRPLHENDHVFFINMPLVAYYAVPAIKAQKGLDNLHGHALTFSPNVASMESPSQVDILDRHTLRVRSPDHERYLADLTGQTMIQAMGFDEPPKQDHPIDAGLFTVTPTEVDERGIRELVFTFGKPLNSPDYHFFLSSPQFMAYPLDVSPRLGHDNPIAKEMHGIRETPRKNDKPDHQGTAQK